MIYRIIEFIFPWEIDDFDRQVNTLIAGGTNTEKIIIDCSLNLSDDIINWENSKISKKYFIEKFKYIETKCKYYFDVEFDTDESIKGCVDKRRICSKKEQDFSIWLDPDLFFPSSILHYLIFASKNITNQLFMISPQIIKNWDSSWDCLVNEKYLNESFDFKDHFDNFSLENQFLKTVELCFSNVLKFAGGWFNLFSQSIFEKISIPDELNSYGLEDTYIMYISNYRITQFLLKNIVVAEISKKLRENKDYIKSNLDIIKIPNEKISQEKFSEIVKRDIMI